MTLTSAVLDAGGAEGIEPPSCRNHALSAHWNQLWSLVTTGRQFWDPGLESLLSFLLVTSRTQEAVPGFGSSRKLYVLKAA
jgi:hypothetical protein